MSKLLLVRHGETELNSAVRYWGRSDIKLSVAGLRQAERLRDRLAAEKIAAIYASDLQRALVTAETIASGHQLAVITCAELREIDFGDVEGLTFDEISQLYPELAKSMIQRSPDVRFPGGGSLDDLNNQISSFMGRLKRHAAEETILIVAHSGVLRTLILRLLGIESKRLRLFRLDLASLSIVETYPEGAILSLLNSTSHLR